MGVSLFIGTPTVRRSEFTQHSIAIAQASVLLASNGISVTRCCVEGHDVAQQRDSIAEQFLSSDCSHLLMVDSDIGYAPELPLTLLAADKLLIGALCPLRQFNLAKLERLIKAGVPADKALRCSHDFAALAQGEVRFANGLATMDAIGAGFMLVRREVFERIEADGVQEYRFKDNPSHPIKQFFPWGRDEKGNVIPEDWGFCFRWRKLGGEVWAYANADMTHVGDYAHTSNALEAARVFTSLKI